MAAEVPAVDGVHRPTELRRDLHEAEALELAPEDLAAPALEPRRGLGEEAQPLAVGGDGVGPGAAVGQRHLRDVLRARLAPPSRLAPQVGLLLPEDPERERHELGGVFDLGVLGGEQQQDLLRHVLGVGR